MHKLHKLNHRERTSLYDRVWQWRLGRLTKVGTGEFKNDKTPRMFFLFCHLAAVPSNGNDEREIYTDFI